MCMCVSMHGGGGGGMLRRATGENLGHGEHNAACLALASCIRERVGTDTGSFKYNSSLTSEEGGARGRDEARGRQFM